MNTTSFFLFLATVLATAFSTSVPDDDFVPDHELYVQYSFDFGLTKDITLYPEEEEFVLDCVLGAFNEFHNPKSHHLKPKSMISEAHTKLSTLEFDRKQGRKRLYPIWRFWWRATMVDGTCRMCPPDLSLKTDSAEGGDEAWEDVFCSKLVDGPFRIFKDARNCKITYKTTEEIMTAAFPASDAPEEVTNLRGEAGLA